MDPIDSGQVTHNDTAEKEKLSELPATKTRQRKKNPKYDDYETDDVVLESLQQKPDGAHPQGGDAASQGGAPPQTTPRRRGRPPKQAAPPPDGVNPGEAPPSDGHVTKTPVRRRKKPQKKKIPKGGAVASGGDAEQQNGTPKPKRKYVKRQHPQPVAEPIKKDLTAPEEGIEPGGRPRRGAAKVALKYLHMLAQDVLGGTREELDINEDAEKEEGAARGPAQRGRKRKRLDSEAAEDEDFQPDTAEEEEEIEAEEEEEEEEEYLDSEFRTRNRSPGFYRVINNMSSYGHPQNGLTGIMMRPVWDSAETTRKFRREHHSSWVFPDWVPSSSDWTPVPPSEVETYLPQELQSAAFTVCREGMKGQPEAPVQRLSRFESSPPHPERWDTSLFVGGPVWALEWCPTPDGAPATQYVALACHRGMEDQHQVHRTYTEPGLVQLWDVSELEYNCRPGSKPTLSLGVALDSGSVWQLKWCPAGCWETPNHVPKPPVLPRLGLLAVATSNGVVTVYSLPHPGTLLAHSKLPASGSDSVSPAIYKARGVVTLKLGSFRAPRHDNSGVPLCIDWLPTKPHNIMVIGFYDGVVGLWDLTTRSALLRVRQPGESMCLLPYRVFLAHQHAVRAVSFCHASRFLLVTGGDDRLVKTWDLRRIWDPVYVMKRNLTNEVYWLLNAPGLMMAQETAFVSRGSHGVHYVDHQQRSIMLAPRTATLWSISYSDWLHSVATSDTQGDVILALLPQLDHNHPYLKRSLARRFPVYLSSLVPSDTAEEENEGMGGGDAEEQEGGEREGAAAEGPNEEKVEGGGGRAGRRKSPRLLLQTYKETSKRNVLQLTDSDMRSFAGSEGRAVWKRMRDMEATTKMSLDHMPLAALHKVRFNPNMTSHPWVASAGRAGLVRLNCLRSMISSHMKKMIGEQQAQFKTECAPLRQEVEVQPDDQVL